ncbi:ATP-binding protein [Clostridium sp. BSD9I1]|uniref:ATP-binding protein n=1 Tax=Clostridium sp. BSD9I1 TaxID=2003589 RepID=UPI00164820EE|nr:ATP-binding protein [Clostridium sp. BSD9I1]
MEISSKKFVQAKYTNQKISIYQDNPYIEALPDIIDNPEKLAELLSRYPYFNNKDLDLPPLYRVQLVRNIESYYKPLSMHFNIEQVISRMIRFGYLHRNSYKKGEKIVSSGQKYEIEETSLSTSPELSIIGISGIGKTTLLKAILSTYPKVILHTNYKGDRTVRYQITWLMVQTPSNGSPKGLCLNLLSQIDEIFGENMYYRKGATKRVAELPEYVRRVVEQHSVGVIVFDELQNLRGLGTKKEEELLNFFVELSNTISVPIVLVGTLKALPLFNSEFRNARRICGEGSIIWNRISKNNEWRAFVQGLFKYQWTKKRVELNDGLLDLLYDKSQGITDIVVKLFIFSQYRAILSGVEKITKGIIKSVAKDYLKPIQPMLDALKRGNEGELSQYEDIYLKKEDWDEFEKREKEKAMLYENLQVGNEEFQNKDEYNKKSKITSITSWLIQAGFNKNESEEVANQIVRNLGADKEINILNRYAYEMITSKDTITKENVQSKSFKKDKVAKKDGLTSIYEEAKAKKQPIYELLKKYNYIAEINEFIV